MKHKICMIFLLNSLLFAYCSSPTIDKDLPHEESIALNSNAESQQENEIIGEWEQVFTCMDKNGNYQLDADEKKPSSTRFGFNWFRFKADGSCLRDKEIKFKGTYQIIKKGEKQKLIIEGGDRLRYNIIALTDNELILGDTGIFIVFNRLKPSFYTIVECLNMFIIHLKPKYCLFQFADGLNG